MNVKKLSKIIAIIFIILIVGGILFPVLSKIGPVIKDFVI